MSRDDKRLSDDVRDKEVMLHIDQTGTQANPASAIVKGGYGIVLWQNSKTGQFASIRARKVHPNGEPIGRDMLLPLPEMAHHHYPAICSHPSGFTCVWIERERDGLIRMGHFDLNFTVTMPPIYFIEPPEGRGAWSSWNAPAVAKSDWDTVGIVAIGRDSNHSAKENAVYFRAFESNGTPWNEAEKINPDDVSVSTEVDIASIDNNNFLIVYTDFRGDAVYAKKVNYLGQSLSDPIEVARSNASGEQFKRPKISVSGSNDIAVAWISYKTSHSGHQIQYRLFKPDLSSGTDMKNISHPSGLSNFSIVSDDEKYLFSICFSDSHYPTDDVYLYKFNYAGVQVAFEKINTLSQKFKSETSLMVFNFTNYFASWRASDFGNDRGDVYGRNIIFAATKPQQQSSLENVDEQKASVAMSKL